MGENVALDCGQVESPARLPQVEHQLVTLHGPGGLLDHAAQLRLDPGQNVIHLSLSGRGEADGYLHIVADDQALEKIGALGEKAVRPGPGVGIGNGLEYVGLHSADWDGIGLAVSGHGEGEGLCPPREFLLQFFLGLRKGQPSNVHARDGGAGKRVARWWFPPRRTGPHRRRPAPPLRPQQ